MPKSNVGLPTTDKAIREAEKTIRLLRAAKADGQLPPELADGLIWQIDWLAGALADAKAAA